MDRYSLAAILWHNIKTVGSFVGLVTLLAASPASATLTLIDDSVFGPMSLVLDTTTNLEWLRVDLTYTGRTGGPLVVLGQMGPGQKFAGLQFAGTNNWASLMGEFGLQPRPGPPGCYGDISCSIDPAVDAIFINLFGIPLYAGVDYAAIVSPPGGPAPSFDGIFFLRGGNMEYSGFGEGCRTQGYGGCDVALVRDAPIAEPLSIWMLIAGLLAFPVASRLSATTRKRHQGPVSIAGTLNAFSPPDARGAQSLAMRAP